MEFMERDELGDGITIDRHRYNTEFGGNTCDFVNMPDQSPENVAKLTEKLKQQHKEKDEAKWAKRDEAGKSQANAKPTVAERAAAGKTQRASQRATTARGSTADDAASSGISYAELASSTCSYSDHRAAARREAAARFAARLLSVAV